MSTGEIKQPGKNNPTFDRADLPWQAARCAVEGQNLELARKKPHMIGHITDIVDPIKEHTIEETNLTIRTNRKKDAADLPSNFDILAPMARTLALSRS